MRAYFDPFPKDPDEHLMRVKGYMPHLHPLIRDGEIEMCETRPHRDGTWPTFCSCGYFLIVHQEVPTR